MGQFMDFLQAIAESFSQVPVEKQHVVPNLCPDSGPSPVIERLCKEAGWNVEERLGSAIWVHFKDSIAQVRKVMIVSSDQTAIILVKSAAIPQGQQCHPKILDHLMRRNAGLVFGAWQMNEPDEGKVTYALRHSFFTAGTDPNCFKVICEVMLEESHAFDAKLRTDGLI